MDISFIFDQLNYVVVNQICHTINEGSLKITSTVPIINLKSRVQSL